MWKRATIVCCLVALALVRCDQPQEEAPPQDLDLVSEGDLGPLEGLLQLWADASCPSPNPSGPPPANFAPAVLDALGCQIWYPATWLALGTPGAVAFASDQQQTVYYSVLLVATPANPWAWLDQVPQSLAQQYGFREPTALGVEAKDGAWGRSITLSFSFLRGTMLNLGRARLFTGKDASGQLRSRLAVTWAPEALIPAWRCLVQQLDASISCPLAAGCSDGVCQAYCADAFPSGLCLGASCACIP